MTFSFLDAMTMEALVSFLILFIMGDTAAGRNQGGVPFWIQFQGQDFPFLHLQFSLTSEGGPEVVTDLLLIQHLICTIINLTLHHFHSIWAIYSTLLINLGLSPIWHSRLSISIHWQNISRISAVDIGLIWAIKDGYIGIFRNISYQYR